MSYPIDWSVTKEHGMRVATSTVSPLNGPSSLLISSSGNEWDAGDAEIGRRASLCLNSRFHERGFADGRLRTVICRNLGVSPDFVWAGVFIMSDTNGIGTHASPGQNRYEITNKDGSIKLIKYTNALPEILAVSSPISGFSTDIPSSLQVAWEYNHLRDETFIRVYLSQNKNFTSMKRIIAYRDSVSLPEEIPASSPHRTSLSEGIFVQSANYTGAISYSFDMTSVYNVVHF